MFSDVVFCDGLCLDPLTNKLMNMACKLQIVNIFDQDKIEKQNIRQSIGPYWTLVRFE